MKKYGRYILLSGFLLAAMFGQMVHSQEETMMLKSGDRSTRPQVRFSHAVHEEKIECRVCHHEADNLGIMTEGEGTACNTCHGRNKTDNPIPLVTAFHRQCKGCHESVSVRGSVQPPVLCGQCHSH